MPLQLLNDCFEVASYTGGSQEGFDVKHILDVSDATVHCSTEGLDQNLRLRCTRPEGVHLSHVVIRAPIRGYGEPLRAGLVWVHEDVQDAARVGAQLNEYDAFDIDERDAFPAPPEGMAYFELERFMECVVPLPHRGAVREVSLKFLDTHGEGANVDVTFVALVGSVAPLSDDVASDPALSRGLEAPCTDIEVGTAAVLEGLEALRKRLSGGVDNLEEVMHYIGDTSLVIGVGTAEDTLDTRALLTRALADSTAIPPAAGRVGFACTPCASREAALLRRQFQSPERPHVAILYVGDAGMGQFVMGEEQPTAEQVAGFVARFLRGELGGHAHGHGHDHGASADADAVGDDDEEDDDDAVLAALASPADLETFLAGAAAAPGTASGAVCALVVTAAWCGASKLSLPLLKNFFDTRTLPAAVVDVDSPAAAALPADVDTAATPSVVLYTAYGTHTVFSTLAPSNAVDVHALAHVLDS